MTAQTMKAAVIHTPGGPEVLQLEERPIPTARPGEVLIRIKAFGLNRSELFTRQGHSPVRFPRILGIEATGLVADCPSGEFSPDDVVATVMGGLGRSIEGSYAEYTVVPAAHAQKVETELDWTTLGAIPEMLQTAHGSLFAALRLREGEVLLVRGGTSSVGLAAAAIAKRFGATVVSTSRRADRAEFLLASGAHHVVVDSGSVAGDVKALFPSGVDKVLELVGTTTLEDSLRCVRPGGSVCMTGMVGNKWSFDSFSPMASIPHTVNLTTYQGEVPDFMATPLTELAQQVADGSLKVQIGKVFTLDEIVEAHRTTEENSAGGKIVILT